jgi:predicted O-methyltransferase YrrM
VGGRIGETGTGWGVGLAWMIDAADASTSFTSIEIDGDHTAATAAMFDERSNVTVLQGDRSELCEYGPFDLLMLDGGQR